MESVETVYTIAYILISICIIAPPSEFVSAGITVQNLLSSYLGSEDMNFVYYHMKRSVATLILHSCLPIGYFIGLVMFSDNPLSQWFPWTLNMYWKLYLCVSIILPLAAITMCLHWYWKKWANHPIAKALQLHAPAGSNWAAVASSINVEFRRIDKFTTGIIGRRMIVTDSWVMKTSTYYVHVAHQQDVHLTLVRADEHELSPESTTAVQYLNILVSSVRDGVGPFHIRLNATEYSDLKEKLHSPVRNARNVVIRQSLSDRFLETFRQHVNQNAVFPKPPEMELEPCIGCMQTRANVKLRKLCHDQDDGDCVQCYCRPMWCLECMSKWFASRQDQQSPETWLAGKSPCPTCRSRFCVLDICKIV